MARGESTTERPKSETEIEFEKKLNNAVITNKTISKQDIRRGGGQISTRGSVCSREQTLLPIVESNSEFVSN